MEVRSQLERMSFFIIKSKICADMVICESKLFKIVVFSAILTILF